MEEVDLDGTKVSAFRVGVLFQKFVQTGSYAYRGTFRIRMEDYGVRSILRFRSKGVRGGHKVTIWHKDKVLLQRDSRDKEDTLTQSQVMLSCVFMATFCAEKGLPLPQPFLMPQVSDSEIKEFAEFIR